MKRKVNYLLGIIGLSALIITATATAVGVNQTMQIRVIVPQQVNLLQANTFKQTGVDEFSNNGCIATTSAAAAYHITGTQNGSANHQLSITTANEGTVRIDSASGAQINSAAALGCAAASLKVSRVASSVTDNQAPSLVSVTIVPE